AHHPGGHKYNRGHVLVLSGGVGRGGAARMEARAALRVGAGLVTLGCPAAALQENAARLDAVMLLAVSDAEALAALLADRRLSCVALGPGLGVGARTRDLVGAACAAGEGIGPRRRVVVDADALTSFTEDPETLFALVHPLCVLTPHEGEFARLFPDLAITARAGAGLSKVDAARRAADRAGCTVLLKGPDTVIASPGGGASIHAASYDRAAPWLGTAGAGDVLAGLIAGLLAPDTLGDSPHPAVEAAAWLHVEAARSFGPGLIAEDLPEELPRVFRALGL
ncbi:MAG: NAD(P)H-hydrate dehydratase, partial [Pseudomonadota bacterium]